MLQNLAALLLWKIDVEDDQGGTGRGDVAIRLIEVPHGLLSIFDDMERDRKLFRLDSFLDQEYVRFVIVHDKHMAPNAGRRFFRPGA